MEIIVGIGHQLPARENDGAGREVIPGLMHLSMVAVEPAYCDLGIGKAITGQCIEKAADLGYEAVQLWTHASNERAQRLIRAWASGNVGRKKTDDQGERSRLYRRRSAGDSSDDLGYIDGIYEKSSLRMNPRAMLPRPGWLRQSRR